MDHYFTQQELNWICNSEVHPTSQVQVSAEPIPYAAQHATIWAPKQIGVIRLVVLTTVVRQVVAHLVKSKSHLPMPKIARAPIHSTHSSLRGSSTTGEGVMTPYVRLVDVGGYIRPRKTASRYNRAVLGLPMTAAN